MDKKNKPVQVPVPYRNGARFKQMTTRIENKFILIGAILVSVNWRWDLKMFFLPIAFAWMKTIPRRPTSRMRESDDYHVSFQNNNYGTKIHKVNHGSRIWLSHIHGDESGERDVRPIMTLMERMSEVTSKALNRTVVLHPTKGGRASGGGGGGTITSAVKDIISGETYFLKTFSRKQKLIEQKNEYRMKMLEAEYDGIMEMMNTNAVKVPRPIAHGNHFNSLLQTNTSFLLLEYLNFTYGCSGYELGQQLAQMHRISSQQQTNHSDANNKAHSHYYGFHRNNTIGATLQPNLPLMDSWADFYDTHRLQHMFQLTNNVGGMSDLNIQNLREKIRKLLTAHEPDVVPCLLHGDLWGGNKGCIVVHNHPRKSNDDKTNENSEDANPSGDDIMKIPVLFDPAPYYGDREADIAMTYLFGGFDAQFYKGYESIWPLPKGHEQRRIIYNLYHILNHYVLFGGTYKRQARDMMKEIMNI